MRTFEEENMKDSSPTPESNKPNNSNAKSKKNNPLWFLGTAGFFILAKGKWILSLLKFGKFGGAIASMLVFTGTYAMLFPISFAIGIVVMLFIHEMGHVIAAKQKKMPVSAPFFIPFVGALVSMKRNPSDAVTEAYIGYGGPLLGTIGATATFGLGFLLDYPVLYSVAYIGFFLNLLNLLPVHPLDGGRISVAVTRWLWVVGLIVAIPVIIYLKSILLGIILVISAWNMYNKYVKKKTAQSKMNFVSTDYYLTEETFYQGLTFIPGENHQRDLSYTAFTELTGKHEGKTIVRAKWDAIQFEEEMVVMTQAIIKRVYAQTKHIQAGSQDSSVCLTVVIEYQEFENEQYYEVRSSTRWKFGLAYFGLAAYLVVMMMLAHQEMQSIMLIS